MKISDVRLTPEQERQARLAQGRVPGKVCPACQNTGGRFVYSQTRYYNRESLDLLREHSMCERCWWAGRVVGKRCERCKRPDVRLVYDPADPWDRTQTYRHRNHPNDVCADCLTLASRRQWRPGQPLDYALCREPLVYGSPDPYDPLRLTVDHIVPRSRGGWGGPCQPVHSVCNSRKGTRYREELDPIFPNRLNRALEFVDYREDQP